MSHYYLALLPFILFILFAALVLVKKLADSRFWHTGSSEKLLRPAGESLRREIEKTDANIQQCLFRTGVAVLLQILIYLFLNTANFGSTLIYLLAGVSCVTVSFTAWNLFVIAILIHRRRRLSQSFLGERIVGEHLNLIILDGYHCYHDLQFEEFTINHAVVGPGGIFGIETKTCPRRKVDKANRILSFDGNHLRWPNGKVNELGFKECAERAKSLQKWLTDELGQTVEVHPVLVFPGWTVDSQMDGPLKVLSPKRIRTFLKNTEQYGNIFPDSVIKQISGILAEKSRLAN